MPIQFTEEWVREHYAKMGKPVPAELGLCQQANSKNKYHNTPTERDGKRFDSKHEAKEYDALRLQGLAGEFKGLATQVPFYLPGGIKYVADFVTLNNDGTFTVYDAKSEATRKDKTYRLKRRQMKECLGIEIQEV